MDEQIGTVNKSIEEPKEEKIVESPKYIIAKVGSYSTGGNIADVYKIYERTRDVNHEYYVPTTACRNDLMSLSKAREKLDELTKELLK